MSSPFKNDNEALRAIDDNSVFGKYYIDVCEIMKSNNVPKDRLPSLVHFMSKAFSCLDADRMEKWVKNYIDNEKIDILDD